MFVNLFLSEQMLSLMKEFIEHNFYLFIKVFYLPFDLTVLLFDCCFEVDTKRKHSVLKFPSCVVGIEEQ